MTPYEFIIIDDDRVSNMVCKMVIEKASPTARIRAFTNPEDGFLFIKSDYKDCDKNSVLLLDINMPVLSGWEFLDLFDQLDDRIKSCIKVYILSSSVDQRDKARSDSNKHVVGHLIKPLTTEFVKMFI